MTREQKQKSNATHHEISHIFFLFILFFHLFLSLPAVQSQDDPNTSAPGQEPAVQTQEDPNALAPNREVELVGRIYGFSRQDAHSGRDIQDTAQAGGTPVFIAQNSKGNLYVTYTGQKQEVQVFDQAGKFLFRFGERGDTEQKFSSYICGLAINSRDEVYVCDVLKRKILVFDAQGKFLFSFSSVQGLAKEDKNQDTTPSHIAIDARDRVYISDTANGHVWVHDARGKYLFPLGGPEQDRFPTAAHIRFDKQGRIYILEGLANRIQVCDPKGNSLFTIGKTGSRAGQFLRISGLAIDSQTRIYVTDIVLSAVQVFDSKGEFLGVIKQIPDREESQKHFHGLAHILIGQKDLIYLIELPFHRLTVIRDKQ
ncbi:MAG: NHL repeat-containing protein [bacterium]